MKLNIQGYSEACNCDHCGRNLKVGIQLEGFGVIGADCLNAAIKFDRMRWGRGKPGASYLRELAIKKQKNSNERLAQMGMTRAFTIEISPEKLNLAG